MRLEQADRVCAAIAEAQHGVFNRRQALRAGHTDTSIHRRVARGTWRRLFHTVYAFAGAPLSWDSRCMAAALLDPGRSAVSGASAARLYGVPDLGQGDVEVSTVGNRNRPDPNVRVRRLGLHLLDHVTMVRGIPATSPALTTLHVAGARIWRADRVLDHLLRTRAATLYEFWDLLDRSWTRGQRGIRWYRDAVMQRTPETAPTQSDLEDLYLRLVRRSDLPNPVRQWPVRLPTLGLVHFDFGYPEARLAIEVDGYAWHMDRAAFERDRQRDLEAQSLGIRVLRLTWAMLKWQREYVVRMIRAQLAADCTLTRV